MKHSALAPPSKPTFFFAMRLSDPNSQLLVQEIDSLRFAMRDMLATYSTEIDAIVVLPNQILAIWTLPDGDVNYLDRWAWVKAQFARRLREQTGQTTLGLWQDSCDVQELADSTDQARYRHKVLQAPCVHGLVTTPQEWTYSSIHRDVDLGLDILLDPMMNTNPQSLRAAS